LHVLGSLNSLWLLNYRYLELVGELYILGCAQTFDL
jgi:hypothetical protein